MHLFQRIIQREIIKNQKISLYAGEENFSEKQIKNENVRRKKKYISKFPIHGIIGQATTIRNFHFININSNNYSKYN